MGGAYLVSGIQQIGIGVADLEESFRWYRQSFGTDIPVFDDAGEAPFMVRYTGGVVQSRRAVLAMNLQGGSGFEIWQYTSRTAEPARARGGGWATSGSSPRAIKARDPGRRARLPGAPGCGPADRRRAGPDRRAPLLPARSLGTPLRGRRRPGVVRRRPSPDRRPVRLRPRGERRGAEPAALPRHRRLRHGDLRPRRDVHGLREPARRTQARASRAPRPRRPAQRRVQPPSRLEPHRARSAAGGAAARRLYDGRFWGDPGFIHLCFDVRRDVRSAGALRAAGFPFTVDSASSFEMGEAAGRFAYVEDPDGALIEFVETHRLAIAKRLGLYLDLRRRDPGRPLPALMLRALALSRVRD